MIETVLITNFKLLESVRLFLGKFNCLVGMNGAGKSTILQAFDLLAQLMHGNVDQWLKARGWESKDLHCRTGHSHVPLRNILLQVGLRLGDGRQLTWTAILNRHTLRMTSERVRLQDEQIFSASRGQFNLLGQKHEITHDYTGSLLASLKDSLLSPELKTLRDTIRNIRSLELLSPHLLRKRSRAQDKDIGAGGEKLSGFLATLKGEQKAQLLAVLCQFYPHLRDFRVARVRGGWWRLMVTEAMQSAADPTQEVLLETEAGQLNDGLLRILAMLAQANSQRSGMLLLDEVENGINPEIVEKLVNALLNSPVQVLVTSHSPMILNYLDDDIARKAVQFVYKNPRGQTRVRPFFELPGIGDKLNYMGPGEAFVDTNLAALTDECVALDAAEDAAKDAEEAAKAADKARP